MNQKGKKNGTKGKKKKKATRKVDVKESNLVFPKQALM